MKSRNDMVYLFIIFTVAVALYFANQYYKMRGMAAAYKLESNRLTRELATTRLQLKATESAYGESLAKEPFISHSKE